MSSPFTLAVCADMQFTELPLVDRVRRIGEYGLAAEIWDWSRPEVDLEAIAATEVPIESMTGYLQGNLTEDDGIDDFLRTAEESAVASQILGAPRLNIHGTGLDPKCIPVRPVEIVTGEMWARAARTLGHLAEIAEKHDVVYQLENLNLLIDHPGTPFARPQDVLALVRTVGSERLRMNLDLYHAQIGDGNLIETCRECLPWVGEIQVADVPGRCEPGTGEISYRAIALALAEAGYTGTVALEASPATTPGAAVTTFVDTFSNL
ncbi:TIM barrel protein [Brachybacterium fresconis]|uniref:Hydroxypyruvate isomerase n=1 Tax=Brachybacterium fresconis TaxID=173363 RepID=A0ABS4YLZ2_9MICO|nr:TIM barrel protein [Brachybacterium fresconis]MBP2409817.1 hydroxypyruvate isomerase [Brachybacterium fresconis]